MHNEEKAMPRGTSDTCSRIIRAAWELFYEKGYDDTTVDDIVARSRSSKGSFYHYFPGKDALLGSLSTLFDEKYKELSESIDPAMNSFEKLIFLNKELFFMIENSISLDLLTRMLSTQLTTTSERHLLDRSRYISSFCEESAQKDSSGENCGMTSR